MEYHWQLIASFRLSWRRTLVLRLYLFIAKRGTLEMLGTSDKLWFRWCFSLTTNSSGNREFLSLLELPREIFSVF